ncbi:hypothetical protein [Candidatus Frankia nodulisporulans]|uniref:hypothetical protein n=1 Tax=Candidatus Frankia nodulisporulans TaxID=2060052 RepID=UPI0013CF54C6|nr:hypothetical protein [Candidatus Frankia nodulisporulans]
MDVKRRLGVADEAAQTEQTSPGSEIEEQARSLDAELEQGPAAQGWVDQQWTWARSALAVNDRGPASTAHAAKASTTASVPPALGFPRVRDPAEDRRQTRY